MITVDEYQRALLQHVRRVPTEWVPIADAQRRVLADDVRAVLANPVFDNSAKDGFAVNSRDVKAGKWLVVDGDIGAGCAPGGPLAPGAARRITTGAPIPEGADCVIPVQATNQPRGAVPLPEQVRIDIDAEPGRHIRHEGEDLRPDELVLPAGSMLRPTSMAALASTGHGRVLVSKRPRVAVIATGNEIVEPGEELLPGQIPDSNSILLRGLLENAGVDVVAVHRCTDDHVEFRHLLDSLQGHVDLLLTTGGISAGAYDVVTAAGTELSFLEVAMQPGRPQAYGNVGGTLMMGLPGNPVSVFVSYVNFVVPVLWAMTGSPSQRVMVTATASQPWRSPTGRVQYVPVVVSHINGQVKACPSHRLGSGSHLIASLHAADGLAIVEADVEHVNVGDSVEVEMLWI